MKHWQSKKKSKIIEQIEPIEMHRKSVLRRQLEKRKALSGMIRHNENYTEHCFFVVVVVGFFDMNKKIDYKNHRYVL